MNSVYSEWFPGSFHASRSPPPERTQCHSLFFVTEDEAGNGTGPILFLIDAPDAVLPRHPRSLTWRYFATIGDDDGLASVEGAPLLDGIETDGFFVAKRLVTSPANLTSESSYAHTTNR
jgi:hypothetical protein